MKLPQPRRYKSDKMNLENLIKDGENAKGFTAQTANGTAHWRGTGWNRVYDYEALQCEPEPTRPAGRNNRTGE